jgi:hypothetical protein
MATRKKKVAVDLSTAGALLVIQPPSQADIDQALTLAQAAVQDLQLQATELTITNQQDYTRADTLLHSINDGDKLVESKFRPVIELLRVPLEAIYELRRGVTVPLEEYRKVVKSKMGEYQLREKRRLDAEAEENRKKAEELHRQWLRDNPPSPVAVARGQQVAIQQPLVTYLAPPSTPAPQASHSSTRFESRIRTVDIDLLVDAATACVLPGLTESENLDLLTVKPSKLQEHFQRDPVSVRKWPGVEVYDHPIITGR